MTPRQFAASLVILGGCAVTNVQSVNHESGLVEIDAVAALNERHLTLVPNEEAIARAHAACDLITGGLTPRLADARELRRAEDGRVWMRYTFRCVAT